MHFSVGGSCFLKFSKIYQSINRYPSYPKPTGCKDFQASGAVSCVQVLALTVMDVYQWEGTFMHSFINFLPFTKQTFMDYLVSGAERTVEETKLNTTTFFLNRDIPEFGYKLSVNE